MQLKRPEPTIVDGVVYNADASVIAWVNMHLGGGITAKEACALGALKEGWDAATAIQNLETSLAAGAYFFDQYGDGDGDPVQDITMALHVEDARAVRGNNVRTLFAYPFVQLGLRRVSAIIDEANTDALDLAIKVGFQVEGKKRRMASQDRDAIMLGMLRDEFRFAG